MTAFDMSMSFLRYSQTFQAILVLVLVLVLVLLPNRKEKMACTPTSFLSIQADV
jgi:hypothetical protein